MEASDLKFLRTLLETPGTSGYEQQVQQVVRDFASPFAAEVTTDWHGNVAAIVNPSGSPRVMLAGHCDQIGLMVRHIDDLGYLWVSPIGGWDVQMLIGQQLTVWTKDGGIPGVIARKAIHLLTSDERKTVPEIKDLWIDIGARDGAEARSLVRPGDPVTLTHRYCELKNGLVAGPAMDDRVGVWVVMKALQLAAEKSPTACVAAVSTVQEEIGLRGARTSAFSLESTVGIAVDVTHATDCPTIEENQHGSVKLGQGPVVYRGPNVNPVVFEKLSSIAEEQQIPVQYNGISRPAGNDANAMQLNRGGMATGIVAIPNRYMHSPVEVVALDDLENAAKLIAGFLLQVDGDTDFTPR